MKTYIIDSVNNIPNKFFINYLNTNEHWVKAPSNVKQVDFAYLSMSHGNMKKYYIISRYISNYFDSSYHMKYITNKSALIYTITKFSSSLSRMILVPSYNILKKNITEQQLNKYKKYFDKYKILILRPTWGFARGGIIIFDDFIKFKSYMLDIGLKNINDQHENECYVLSQFITKQMQYKGHVFNLRIYLLISKINNVYYGGWLKNIRINLAKTKYEDALKNINTNNVIGLVSSYNYINFMELFTGNENMMNFVFEQIKHIINILFHIIKKHNIMKNYNNVDNSCEIFGLDMIITDNMIVKLIEFNHKPGLFRLDDISFNQLVGLFIDLTINKAYKSPYNILIPDTIKSELIYL